MSYPDRIQSALHDPQALEKMYQTAVQSGEQGAFREAIEQAWQAAPDDLLLSAWHYRLQPEASTYDVGVSHWKKAVLFAVLTGLLFWALSDFNRLTIAGGDVPYLVLVWAPLAAAVTLFFLALTGPRPAPRRLAGLVTVLLAASAWVVWGAPALLQTFTLDHYLTLSGVHLPILAWGALGLMLLGWRSPTRERFAFLIKSVEVIITAGLYLMAGVAFVGITVDLFYALGIGIPEQVMRPFAVGGFGLLPVLAVASVYNPARSPAAQDFSQGLSRFVHTLMRLLLLPTLVVLVIYTLFIPFNFIQPFQERDVLIVYNIMLFAVMGLLLGATPLHEGETSDAFQRWLRRGLIGVAALALLVSVYAVAATVYRTVSMGGLTMNRMTIIGWNVINIAILGVLLYRQARSNAQEWIATTQEVFALATNAYLVWALFIVLFLPVLF